MLDEALYTEEGIRENLEDLRGDSLNTLLIFVGVAAALCMCWFVQTEVFSAQAWSAAIVLVLGVVFASKVKGRSNLLASTVLILSMLGAISSLLCGYDLRGPSYLLALPVTFAALLIGFRPMFATAITASVLMVAVGLLVYGESPLSPHVLSPVIFICLTALASWLSNRNLYAALHWAWNGYRQARHNEEQLRERQVHLKRALKALDEANYRIRSMNYQLALATERAEEARRLKQQFAANISHELRTPLNLIVGFSEMMFLSPESYGGVQLPPPYRGDVDAIYRSGQHLLSLIDDVLDLSQIEAGHMTLTKERINLGEVIEEAADIIDSFVEAKGLSLQIELPDDMPLVYADRTRLRQVLLNLLNNSCRFTERGSITIRVEVKETEVMASVTDTGIGIPQDAIPRIFEEFYPLDGSTTRQGGRGLGLPLSRRFVELHGGRMWVESQVHRGSTFCFTLPLPELRTRDLYQGMPSAGEHIPPFPTALEASFLILHSDPAVTRMLQRHIDGFRAVQAHDESEALPLIEEYHPRAIVSGSHPDLRGHEQSTLGDTFDDLPLVICPLLHRPWARLALSANEYLIKPITREKLFSALDRVDGEVKSVLVVDDNPQMVRLLDRMLRSGGRRYEVWKAYSGEQALALMERRRPDVVLLDLMMPGIDGPEVLRRMRANAELANVPVIVITVREYLQELLPSGDTIQIERKGGFSTSELVNLLKAILDSLPPQPTFPTSVPARPATSPG